MSVQFSEDELECSNNILCLTLVHKGKTLAEIYQPFKNSLFKPGIPNPQATGSCAQQEVSHKQALPAAPHWLTIISASLTSVRELSPTAPSVEKLTSMKPIPSAKKVGDC